MKISVFFDNYMPFHEQKDLGQIPLGLIENGVEASVITVAKPELADYHPAFEVVQKPKDTFFTAEFWRKTDSDVVIAYTVSGGGYSQLLGAIKAGGKRVILKFDSDGKLGYPHMRHTHRIPLRERFTAANVANEAFWRLAPATLKRRKHAAFAAEAIRQMEQADAAVIESPKALENLRVFFSYWGRSELADKAVFIPNSVTPEFVEGAVAPKENVAVAHGRWDDYKVKNTAAMVAAAVGFLKARGDWRFEIFGSGTELVKRHLSGAPGEVQGRINVSEFVPHSNVKIHLAPAKLLFVPSRWESFSLAAAEAVCSGCSVVGTPAEALQYLCNGGLSGTVSLDFKTRSLTAALLEDAAKWDKGSYKSQEVAAFWRPKLNRKAVAQSILALARN